MPSPLDGLTIPAIWNLILLSLLSIIRTVTVRDGVGHVRTGAGVVIGSEPPRGIPGMPPQGGRGKRHAAPKRPRRRRGKGGRRTMRTGRSGRESEETGHDPGH